MSLAAEKKKYSEVTGVIRAIDSTKDVRDFSVVTEVSWADYIDAIAAVLPEGVAIESFEVDQASPTQTAPDSGDPVIATGLGTISFVAKSPTLPDASDWADELNKIPGLQDASIQEVTLDESSTSDSGRSTGEDVYTVNATAQINQLALAQREFEDREVGTDAKKAGSSEDGDQGDDQ